MSWSISTQGSPDSVQEKVEADPHVPMEVKQALTELLAMFPSAKAIRLDSHGHLSETQTGSAALSVTTLTV